MSDECIGRRRVLMRRAHALSTAQHSAFAVMCLSLHSQSHSHSVLRLGPPRSLSHERTAEMFAQRTKARAQLAPVRTRVVAEPSRAAATRASLRVGGELPLASSRAESFRSFSRLLLWPPFLFVRCVVRVESSGSIHTCICCSSALSSLLFTCIHRHMHMHRVPQIYSTLRSRTRARARTTYTLRGIGKPLDFTDSLDRQRAAIAMPCHATLLQCTACVAKHNNFNGRK